MVEASLNERHMTQQVDPNFTLDQTKKTIVDTLQVMVQTFGAYMQGEKILALHHTMTYKI